MTSQPDSVHPTDLEDGQRMIAALDNPLAFGHPVRDLNLIETHISWVILTGGFVYKIKKPVDFGFLDFSSLEKRRFYCEEELRLNRRFAAEIYLEVVAIRGSPDKPRLHGDGEVIDYAVKMLEFPQQDLLSAYAGAGSLCAEHIDAIADTLAEAHRQCDPAGYDSDWGSAESVNGWSAENLDHIEATVPAALLPESFQRLRQWYRHDGPSTAVFDQRRRAGFVRECHGDCHLGNMAWIDGRVVLFDCIEFNPELRWIDTISEIAFVAMDLEARGYREYCWRFINRYLAHCGDYAGIALLRYYLVYRALVRAKVEALRVTQEYGSVDSMRAHLTPALDYIELARRWADSHRPGLILMHGMSGSGKSTIAAQLAQNLGAIQIRSDVERKRLFDLDADATSGSALDQGIYSADAGARTYRRLVELAQAVLDADYCVIVDATFLRESQRRDFLRLESRNRFNRLILHCDAPVEVLRERIAARSDDPSEADIAVLEHQLDTLETISQDERQAAQFVQVGVDGLDLAQIDRIRALIDA